MQGDWENWIPNPWRMPGNLIWHSARLLQVVKAVSPRGGNSDWIFEFPLRGLWATRAIAR